ncbi:pullulanase [Mycobacterium sp. 1274761.0]|uniref:pullulanase n=1 Tax=Mycobacterium sp. 1274761.0 TaxID=1834077 RepID=UPI0007FC880D|nr:pullulanase [Mycobacterium sp. 1274761.0]OBK77410.1 pullulanase [Mycobacterium sp. 1274761.0]
MDYCLSDGDGSATMWTAPLDTDVDGNGTLDAVGLDVDGDGGLDDALADLDGDGTADHAVLNGEAYFTDDGSGTWTVSADRGGVGPQLARGLRWFGLDGAENVGGPTVDLDGDGKAADRLIDTDGNGLADRALGDGVGYVDTDGDGTWDIKLTDKDGDGRADAANAL